MLEQEEKDNEAVSKMMALDQKNQLLNLFQEKNRPVLARWPQVDSRQPAIVRNWMCCNSEVSVTPPHLCRAPTCFTSFLCFLWTSGKSSSGVWWVHRPFNDDCSSWLSFFAVCCVGDRRNRPPCLTWATLCCCVHMGASCSPMTPWSMEMHSSELASIQYFKCGVHAGLFDSGWWVCFLFQLYGDILCWVGGRIWWMQHVC